MPTEPSPEEINMAIALDQGWKFWRCEQLKTTQFRPPSVTEETMNGKGGCKWTVIPPPDDCLRYGGHPRYDEDLNSMHRLELDAPDEYWDVLAEETGCDSNPFRECAPAICWRAFASAHAWQRARSYARAKSLTLIDDE